MVNKSLYPKTTKELAAKQTALASEYSAAWKNFSKSTDRTRTRLERSKKYIFNAVAQVCNEYTA